MTDDAPPVDEAPAFVLVPSAETWRDLLDRLELLEAQQPAEGDSLAHDRLDRHRAELEAIKRAFNALVEYVSSLSPDPGSAPQPLQPAPTATTPTREDYL